MKRSRPGRRPESAAEREHHHPAPAGRSVAPEHELRALQRALGNRRVLDLLAGGLLPGCPPGDAAPAPRLVEEVVGSHGLPLASGTRRRFEHLLGVDLRDVLIHRDERAARAAESVAARAFTVGDHVVLGATVDPTTVAGQGVLAHELVHVVQQRGAAAPASLRVAAGDSVAEAAARAGTRALLGGRAPRSIAPLATRAVQRDGETSGLAGKAWRNREKIVEAGAYLEWTVIENLLEGVLEESVAALKSGRIAKIRTAKGPLETDPKAYLKGLAVGIGEGLWMSLEGLVDLVTLPFRLAAKLDGAMRQITAQITRDPEGFRKRVESLLASFDDVSRELTDALNEFASDPEKVAHQLSGIAAEKAREAGRAAAQRVFEFYEMTPYESGELAGKIIGMVLFEVLVGLITEGIGDVVAAVATAADAALEPVISALGRWTRTAAEALGAAFARLGRIIEEVRVALRGVSENLGKLLERLGELIKEAKALIASLGDALEPEVAIAGGGRVRPSVLMMEAPKGPRRLPGRSLEELTGGRGGAKGRVEKLAAEGEKPKPRGRRPETGKYVEPYEEKLERIPEAPEVAEARARLASDFQQKYLPEGSKVRTREIPRTEAGRAQQRAVTPEGSKVLMDVELDVVLPSGTRFAPDGVEFVGRDRYLFLEHKEVLTAWEKSSFSRAGKVEELDAMLSRHAEIYLQLKEKGCAGFQYSTNTKELADLLAERISLMKGEGRKGLLAPPL